MHEGNSHARQRRGSDCIAVLDTIVREGDAAAFRDLNYRVNNHGKPAPAQLQTPQSSVNGFSQLQGASSSLSPGTMPPGRAQAPRNGAYAGHHNRMCKLKIRLRVTVWTDCADSATDFKTSPFYEDHEVLEKLMDLPGKYGFHYISICERTYDRDLQNLAQKCHRIDTL